MFEGSQHSIDIEEAIGRTYTGRKFLIASLRKVPLAQPESTHERMNQQSSLARQQSAHRATKLT